MIQKGVKPENILTLTFSDKSAREMLGRLEKQMNTSDLTVSTFHSFALSILEDNVLESGLSFSSGIISRANQLVWGSGILTPSGLSTLRWGTMLSRSSSRLLTGSVRSAMSFSQ